MAPRAERVARCTDEFKLTKHLRSLLTERTEAGPNDCLVYCTPENGRHISAERYAGGTSVVSVRRIAWALAHPESRVEEWEEVVHTCGTVGDHTNGNGCCINSAHLVKVSTLKEAA